VELPGDRYFRPGDIQKMAEKIIYFTDKTLTESEKAAQIKMIAGKYNWEKVADQTLEVYGRLISKK
jgi:glycosyltransferase involved in cell wall biosynthesis